MNELISVIVPIYNSQSYMNKCIKSIIDQTYTNLEILLIDDGSSDNSASMCDEFALNDSRIRVFHKKNSGIGKTRDYAIKKASGKYIAFIDSDDFVSKDYIEYLYRLLSNNNADVSQCAHYEVYNCKYREIKTKKEENTFSGQNAITNMLYEKEIDSSFWGKLIKKELFENLNFGNYKKFEDFDLIYKIFNKCDSIIYGNQYKYYYNIRVDSLMNEKFSNDNLSILEIIDNLSKYYTSDNFEINKAINHRKICADFYIIRNCQKNTELYLKLKNEINSKRKEVLKDKNSSKKAKVAIIISYINYDFVKYIFRLKKKIVLLKTKFFGKKIEM